MKVSIITILLGITCFLLNSVSSNHFNKQNHLNFLNLRSVSQLNDAVTLIEKYQRSINLDKSYGRNNSNSETFSENEMFVLDTLASFIKFPFDMQKCLELFNEYCPLIRNQIENMDGLLKEKFKEFCATNSTEICHKLVKTLHSYCSYVKTEYDVAINIENKCLFYQEKCRNLEQPCGDLLKNMCSTVKDKCKDLEGYITNFHTVIVDTTITSVETVEYTHTEVSLITQICCNNIHYTSCQSLGPSKPTLSTLKKPDSNSEPSPDNKECSITLISTVTNNIGGTHTITVTMSPDSKDDKAIIKDKAEGIQMQRLHGKWLIYMVIGIIIGTWIII